MNIAEALLLQAIRNHSTTQGVVIALTALTIATIPAAINPDFIEALVKELRLDWKAGDR